MKFLDRQFFAAALFSVILAFAFQGTRGLWPDETRYSNAAAEMLRSGDYLVSRINHLPFLNKPPLQIWGLAACLKLFGHNEWGARASNALCLLATALAVGFLARAWWGRNAGTLAAMIYVSLPGTLGAANAVTPDTPLTLWLALALVCFWKSLPGEPRAGPWKVLLGAVLALGALTKGPAALLPTGAMLVFLLLRGQLLRFFFSPWMLAGAAVFLLPVAGWYSLVIKTIPGAAECFWSSQVWGRLVSNVHDRHPKLLDALWIYGPMLAATLPWPLAALASEARGQSCCCSRGWWQALRQRPVALLLLLWVLLPTLILCLSSSKQPLYILPVYPAVALACARGLMKFQTSASPPPPISSKTSGKSPPGNWAFSSRLWALFICWGIILLAAKAFFAYRPDARDVRAEWQAIEGRLPAGPFRLVAFGGLNGQGLGFYSGASVVETSGNDPSYLIQEGPLKNQIEQARHSVIPRVFVFKKPANEKKRAEKGLRPPEKLLAEAGIQFEKQDLPLNITLLNCRPGRDEEPTARVMLVGDPGGGIIGFNAANALQRLSEDMNLAGIVFPSREFCAADSAAWAPYTRILSNNVPFYTREGPAFVRPKSFNQTSVKFGELLEVFFATKEQGGETPEHPLEVALRAGAPARHKIVVFDRLPEGAGWAKTLSSLGVGRAFSIEPSAYAATDGDVECFKCDPQSMWLIEATEKNILLRHYDSLGRAADLP